MKRTLTVVSLKELPPGWQDDFPFEYLSVKPNRRLLFGEKDFDDLGHQLRTSDGWVDQIAEAKRLVPPGVEVHAWEWFGARNVAEGKAWGQKHGKLATKHKLKRFKVDAEAEWSGGDGFPETTEPYATPFEAVVQFYLFAPENCELVFNGFSWARSSFGHKLYDEDLLRSFTGGRLVMTHGTNRAALGKTARAKLKAWPGIPVIMQMGVGRKAKDGAIWGFWDVYKGVLRDYEKLTGRPLAEVDWYMGNGAGYRYFTDSPDYPAIVKCARELAPHPSV